MPLVLLKETSLRSAVRGSASTSRGDSSFGLPVSVEEDRRLQTVLLLLFLISSHYVVFLHNPRLLPARNVVIHDFNHFSSIFIPSLTLTLTFICFGGLVLSYMYLFSQPTTTCVYDFTNLGGSHCTRYESS